MKLPNLDPIAEAIDAYHASCEDMPRLHLGASMLGHHCDRWLWLSFRWAVREKFSGRMLRLFRRGQMEEATIVSDLRAIGIDIGSTGGQQSRVNFGKHVSGSLDGVIESGVIGAENKRHIAEFKTHSKKSFDDVTKNGVEASKPMHWAQMQVYMHGKGIDRALYGAVCKDDDRYHFERIRYDKEAAQALVDRGHRITMSERLPEPCTGASPDWYQCKFCPAYDFCHGSHLATEVNCRTCSHITPRENDFYCERWAQPVPNEIQPLGCDAHVAHPDLVPWKMLDSENDYIARWSIDGVEVANGEPAEFVYRTREIIANPDYCKAPTEEGEYLRMTVCAEVTSAS